MRYEKCLNFFVFTFRVYKKVSKYMKSWKV